MTDLTITVLPTNLGFTCMYIAVDSSCVSGDSRYKMRINFYFKYGPLEENLTLDFIYHCRCAF